MKDLHEIWPHRWVTEKAKAENSKIHGLGVVSMKKISKGEDVALLGGIIIPKSEIREYWEKIGHVGIQIDDNFFICPTTRTELNKKGVFNHSCDPNLGFDGSIKFIAIKDIPSREELVFDYGFNETFFDEFKCNCGAKNCRKTIKPTDWKNKDLQKKYGKYFSPYLIKKIN